MALSGHRQDGVALAFRFDVGAFRHEG